MHKPFLQPCQKATTSWIKAARGCTLLLLLPAQRLACCRLLLPLLLSSDASAVTCLLAMCRCLFVTMKDFMESSHLNIHPQNAECTTCCKASIQVWIMGLSTLSHAMQCIQCVHVCCRNEGLIDANCYNASGLRVGHRVLLHLQQPDQESFCSVSACTLRLSMVMYGCFCPG